jgi:hypothetical protein
MFRLRSVDGDAAYEEMVKGMLKAVTVLSVTNSYKFWLHTLDFPIHDFLSKVQFLLNNNLYDTFKRTCMLQSTCLPTMQTKL